MPPTQFSNRCSSLTASSCQFLGEIGAWEHLQQDRMTRYQDMRVWDGVSGARIDFEYERAHGVHNPQGQGMACMVENLNLTSGLLKRLEELGSVSTFDKSKVESISFGEETEDGADLREWPVVHLAGGKQLYARLLVGADGANSPVRSFAGIKASGWDYNRHGVVATLQLENTGYDSYTPGDPYEAPKVAYQRFLPTGPVAMLPMPGNYSTLVWSTTPENAALLKKLSPQDFTAMVNAAFRLSTVDLEYLHTQPSNQADEVSWRLQHTPVNPHTVPATVTGVQEGSIASFPLKFRHADTYIAERVALIGDAAHTVHPLAGQGLNMGQGDVQSLAKTIQFAVNHGLDIGATMSLEAYNAERYAANHVLMGVCDKLHKLYSVGSGPLVPLRSLGLNLVNSLGPLKGFLMDRAAGNGRML
jgi:ubiquinone biosynthesis monooxygenase Coq6